MFIHHRNSKTTQEKQAHPTDNQDRINWLTMIFHLRNTGAPHECKSTWSFSSILEYFHVRTPVLPFFLFEHYQMHKRIYLILKIFISISTLSP